MLYVMPYPQLCLYVILHIALGYFIVYLYVILRTGQTLPEAIPLFTCMLYYT